MLPGVSIIACTNRPEFFANILANYKRQRYARKELIIIVNLDSADIRRLRREASRLPHVSVYRVPERVSLGQCLNCGISRAKHELIAKLDHDDYYSPGYLREQVKELRRTRSSVVGKHSCLVYLEASRQLLVRSPRERDKEADFVQGGTILFHRRVLKDVRFPDRSLGEDVRFLRSCKSKGHRIRATSPYRYVYIRRKDKGTHTWRVGDRFYRKGSRLVAVTGNYRPYADREA
ncbi:Glycosyltransferase [Paenibacillus pasadenensis]|uniref:Glycosyltransferase n=1 Tax=Paenibacillus pasadenensis TaxID=217090 RepID=A0A2N5NCC4_9BACL|nr:glycosyltransferase family A protein [Paenibacillus pasadenensis]PLT48002.1 Glycosyltransferase [Paenibacillus pasadenensis]